MVYTGQQKRQYQLKWLSSRRQAWIDSQGGKCVKCGSTDDLEIDHIDRKLKTMQPAAIWSRAEHIRELELSNCQVLCVVCHMIKTKKELSLGHGHIKSYQLGCRCDECKAINAARVRRQRAIKAQFGRASG